MIDRLIRMDDMSKEKRLDFHNLIKECGPLSLVYYFLDTEFSDGSCTYIFLVPNIFGLRMDYVLKLNFIGRLQDEEVLKNFLEKNMFKCKIENFVLIPIAPIKSKVKGFYGGEGRKPVLFIGDNLSAIFQYARLQKISENAEYLEVPGKYLPELIGETSDSLYEQGKRAFLIPSLPIFNTETATVKFAVNLYDERGTDSENADEYVPITLYSLSAIDLEPIDSNIDFNWDSKPAESDSDKPPTRLRINETLRTILKEKYFIDPISPEILNRPDGNIFSVNLALFYLYTYKCLSMKTRAAINFINRRDLESSLTFNKRNIIDTYQVFQKVRAAATLYEQPETKVLKVKSKSTFQDVSFPKMVEEITGLTLNAIDDIVLNSMDTDGYAYQKMMEDTHASMADGGTPLYLAINEALYIYLTFFDTNSNGIYSKYWDLEMDRDNLRAAMSMYLLMVMYMDDNLIGNYLAAANNMDIMLTNKFVTQITEFYKEENCGLLEQVEGEFKIV